MECIFWKSKILEIKQVRVIVKKPTKEIKWIHESTQSIQKKAEQEEKGTRTDGTNRKYSKMADLNPTYPYSHRKYMA